jgi:hypothetical protein
MEFVYWIIFHNSKLFNCIPEFDFRSKPSAFCDMASRNCMKRERGISSKSGAWLFPSYLYYSLYVPLLLIKSDSLQDPNLRRHDVMEGVSQRRFWRDTKDRVQLSLEWGRDISEVQRSSRETQLIAIAIYLEGLRKSIESLTQDNWYQDLIRTVCLSNVLRGLDIRNVVWFVPSHSETNLALDFHIPEKHTRISLKQNLQLHKMK